MKNTIFPALLCLAAALLLTGCPASQAQDDAALRGQDAPANSLWLDTLDLKNVTQDYGEPHAGKSVDNNPLTLNGVVYPHGLGTHAASRLLIDLKGSAVKFEALAGVDDEKKGSHASVQFSVFVDGKKKLETKILRGGDAPVLISVDLTGAKRLTLVVNDGEDGIDSDHADWAGALLTLTPGASQAMKPVTLADVVSVEPAMPIFMGADSPVPAIHGPRITGATPGHPFLFLIPATGTGPLTYSAQGLPAGLTLDKNTGVISGALQSAGTSKVRLSVTGPRGKGERTLTVVGGDHPLALTPPLGWNSWNVWAGKVDAGKVRDAADQLIAAGLAAHGYLYVNIDDTWEAGRDANGVIQTNDKFPDMKALADYVHSQRACGSASTRRPAPQPARGYTASYQHEQQDADTYAAWGIDYLKYDWCSYGNVATGDGVERAHQALPCDGRGLAKDEPGHSVQPVPVRHGGCLDLGSHWRQLLADDRRHSGQLGQCARHYSPARTAMKSTPGRATGTTRTC